MIKVKVNQKSISTKVKKLLEMSEVKAKGKLKDIAEDLITRTPVDSGAYAESFSVKPSTSSGGRSKSSNNRQTGQDLWEYRNLALSNMQGDIDGLDLEDIIDTSVSFRNRAPHAGYVEDKYQVFGSVKDIHK